VEKDGSVWLDLPEQGLQERHRQAPTGPQTSGRGRGYGIVVYGEDWKEGRRFHFPSYDVEWKSR